MNINFNVLWFEDDSIWRETSAQIIHDSLESLALTPKIKYFTGGDFDISQITDRCEIDLILMDFALAEGTHGDKIIQQIRKCNILAEILFYSADYNNLLGVVKGKVEDFAGVYFSDREDSFDSIVENLIRKIVRRSQDIVNLRGVVMDQTSEYEIRMKEIFIRSKNILPATTNSIMAKYLYSLLIQGRDSILGYYDELLDKNQPTKKERLGIQKTKMELSEELETILLENTIASKGYIFDNTKQTKYFQCLLKELKQFLTINESIHKNYTPLCQTYYDRIQKFRNGLAHVKTGDKTLSIKNEQFEINSDLFIKIMRNLNEFNEFLKSVEKALDDFISKQEQPV